MLSLYKFIFKPPNKFTIIVTSNIMKITHEQKKNYVITMIVNMAQLMPIHEAVTSVHRSHGRIFTSL